MDLIKSKIFSILLLFLLLANPCLSSGRLHMKIAESEVYVIDYRGPETHTYIPPPDRAGDRPNIHHQTSMARHRSTSFKAPKNGKKIYG